MFQNITENPDNWDNQTSFAARGFLSVLQDINFNFLLISAKASPGYHELKKHKPWFDEGCSELLDQRKQAKLQ
jgi:hypothetical protein